MAYYKISQPWPCTLCVQARATQKGSTSPMLTKLLSTHTHRKNISAGGRGTSGAGRAKWCYADAVNSRARSRTPAVQSNPPGRRRRPSSSSSSPPETRAGHSTAAEYSTSLPFPPLRPHPRDGTPSASSNRKIKGKRTNPPSPPINQTHAAAAASERATYDQERRTDPSTDPPPPPESFLFYVNQPCRVKEPLNCPVIRSGLSSSSPPHTVSPASLGAKLPLPIPGPSGGLSLGGAC